MMTDCLSMKEHYKDYKKMYFHHVQKSELQIAHKRVKKPNYHPSLNAYCFGVYSINLW